MTVQEGSHELSAIIVNELIVKGRPILKKIPKPNSEQKKLLDALRTNLPKTLPFVTTKVATQKKLSLLRKINIVSCHTKFYKNRWNIS